MLLGLVSFHFICRREQAILLIEGFGCQKYSLRYFEAEESIVLAGCLDLCYDNFVHPGIRVEEFFVTIILNLDAIIVRPLLDAMLVGDHYCHGVVLKGIAINEGL